MGEISRMTEESAAEEGSHEGRSNTLNKAHLERARQRLLQSKGGFRETKTRFLLTEVLRVFEGFFFFNLGLVVCNEDKEVR